MYDQKGETLYDEHGEPRDPNLLGHRAGTPPAFVKGTLFLQHPGLDKRPPVATTLSPATKGMCAYHVRDELYYALTDKMLELLPMLLDKEKRKALVEKALHEKELLDGQPHRKVGELGEAQLTAWQGQAFAFAYDNHPHGVEFLKMPLSIRAISRMRCVNIFPALTRI